MSLRRRFSSVAIAGVTFQGGSAVIDSATIVAALVYQLTGSSIAVGAVTTILRIGWLFPQLFVGFLAQRGASSRRYYVIGAFGRAACIALLAGLLFHGQEWSPMGLAIPVLALWTAYAFVSGIVAVPYNDIVARAVPSEYRSRLLAVRFFGGGMLGLAAAAAADHLLTVLPFPSSFGAIFGMAAVLMFASSIVFTSMGDPPHAKSEEQDPTFGAYLREGRRVFQDDRRFRLFVYAQWSGGAALMAMPFYVLQAAELGLGFDRVAILLGAQTAGALTSNVLWGWWGDTLGKASLMRGIAGIRMLPPAAFLLVGLTFDIAPEHVFLLGAGVFFVLGAISNGLTIAVIGLLMEISPDDRRPAYSGYFNALTSPAYLLPLVAGVIASSVGLTAVFVLSLVGAAAQFFFVARIPRRPSSDRP